MTSSTIASPSAFSGPAPAARPHAAGPVVLAGGHALVRAARRSVLERAGVEVAADVADADEAAEAAVSHEAAAVLVDGTAPERCRAAIRRIVERAPQVPVLVVAPELDPATLLAAVRAGARGFIPETLGPAGLARAAQVALRGEVVIPRAGVTTLIEQVRTRGAASLDGLPSRLTRREADVLARLRAGMTPKQIAYELGLSAVTVRRHVSAAVRKTGGEGRARPASLAFEPTS